MFEAKIVIKFVGFAVLRKSILQRIKKNPITNKDNNHVRWLVSLTILMPKKWAITLVLETYV